MNVLGDAPESSNSGLMNVGQTRLLVGMVSCAVMFATWSVGIESARAMRVSSFSEDNPLMVLMPSPDPVEGLAPKMCRGAGENHIELPVPPVFERPALFDACNSHTRQTVPVHRGPRALDDSGPVVPFPAPPPAGWLFFAGFLALLGIVRCAEPASAEQDAVDGSCSPPNRGRVLLLTGDAGFAQSVELCFRQAGYAFQVRPRAEALVAMPPQVAPWIVLVDLRVDNWDLLRTDEALCRLPIVGLVPAGLSWHDEDCIAALERGMDGVQRWEDGPRLLLAKVNAYLRRAGRRVEGRGVYQVGAVEVDTDFHEVRIAGKAVPVSAKPFAVLEALMRAPGKVFSRRELMDLVWGPDFAIHGHTLDVHIHTLRRLLARDPDRSCRLVTVKGVGFTVKPAAAPRPCPAVPFGRAPAGHAAAFGLSRPFHARGRRRVPAADAYERWGHGRLRSGGGAPDVTRADAKGLIQRSRES